MSSPPPKKRACWNVRASEIARNTHNPIRKIIDGMKLTPNPEKEMIALSIGDPTVFGNLLPAEEVREAVVAAARGTGFHGYAPSIGYEEARAAVAEKFSCPEALLTSKEVVFASGCSGALDLCITVLANPGQNILVPRPGFSLYKTLADSLSIQVRFYDLLPDHQWEVDLEHLEALVDSQTAAIVVNNPSNPCGSVYSKEHIQDILAVAERNKVPIIADEIYADFVFPGETYCSMASQTQEVPILSCGGLTKLYIVPGWRMGWITIHDRHDVFAEEVKAGLLSLSQRILGPNTIIQGALKTILTETPQSFFDTTIAVVKENADECFESLKAIKGLKPVMPKGAMYMMIGIDIAKFPSFKSDVDFTERMVTEQSVFCLPASCFKYENYFRIVLTVPREKMREACVRIAEYCTTHYRESGSGMNGV